MESYHTDKRATKKEFKIADKKICKNFKKIVDIWTNSIYTNQVGQQ